MTKKNKLFYFVITLIGTISLLLVLIDFFVPFLIDYARGFFLSFGISIVGLSIYYSISKKYKEKIKISSNDERIQMIENKVFSYTYLFHMLLFIIGIIIFAFNKKTQIYSIILSLIIMVENIFAMIIKYILHKKL